ncbi:MAG TPA: NAD-dependent epimerase/dehydratase family protein, partial [Thermoanaerobaculia bacterium]|nr:NAD-dependent epimerase/dehydratase family protein [Thermoanaerobaculia bacterium]
MNVAIAGGTGFIGTALVRRLLERGDQVLVISRNPANVRDGRGIGWDAAEEIAAADAVINLAGENVGGGWWTAARKRRIMESRAHATTVLVDAIRRRPAPGRAFISASAVGYYGDRGGEILDETASAGDGFLAGVTRRWEELAR